MSGGKAEPGGRVKPGWAGKQSGWREVLEHIAQSVVALLALVISLTLGWLLAGLLFRLVGYPPVVVEYLVAAILGLACLVGGSFLLSRIFRRGRAPLYFGQSILDALEKMAHGDFTVRIEEDEHNPLSEVVESVNKMARDLGSLEEQRQGFVSNVSHEIQSPLTSIAGFTALLRRDDLDAVTRSHYLDVIAAEAARLSRLGDNLLRLSVLDDDVELQVGQFRLDEQLRSVILMLEPQWQAAGLTVELEAGEAVVAADEEMLRQVWVNLLQNAIKFTPAGGVVQVRLHRVAEPGGPEMWCCAVADSGIGIAPADLPHVFERFFRADKARPVGGNGLGLALAKRIVELHRGKLEVSSQVGEGTVFSVYIPLTQR